MSAAFLPFARPIIDEAMIAAVADTLRSRWIASGPQVQAFETALSAYVGGRPVRALTSATGAMEVGAGDCSASVPATRSSRPPRASSPPPT